MPQPSASARSTALDLIDFIDASPTPWHAVATAVARLAAAGFTPLEESERWQLEPGGRYYTVRGGASLLAFVVGSRPLVDTGLRIVGAHVDSPGLRLKPQPALAGDGLARLAVEVYGGPILATFADRDLTLAGRVVVRTKTGQETRLVRFTRPLLRLANLPIHMNREVNEQGLKFNRQTELPLLLGQLGLFGASDETSVDARLRGLLAGAAQAEACDLLSWEMLAHDLQPGSLWGASEEFIASRQLDNLASSHAALSALLATRQPAATCVAGLFDHEEVGSESATGAAGSFCVDVLERIAAQTGCDAEDRRRALARSFFVSADMAHAYQPNFPAAFEPAHRIMINGGPVIKTNVNQRYATNAETAARFMRCCEQAGVPFQQYAHRADLGCGSTIGPLLAARLGVAAVDVGSPLWAMHSARESAGVADQEYMIAALRAVFAD
ncbi:putative M18 family aminopeptidase 2 [Sterolibacterium denitrificans]|uniref:M18 family aminopeptidase n=2 Tax=Sterolibacterium denitrificans TaxID=157592 RepID=A0A656Z6X0_9PROT|nr:M18 family aminopeptidase [Sterolibacterium denitrificans]KYC28864.1 aminopeptidase [Sterolibacterium denitrificans]SMB21144.1 putative M18 family aminopeptidase 2 [Sterolibacterium denitrificans]